jgi:hypothetical protein
MRKYKYNSFSTVWVLAMLISRDIHELIHAIRPASLCAGLDGSEDVGWWTWVCHELICVQI